MRKVKKYLFIFLIFYGCFSTETLAEEAEATNARIYFHKNNPFDPVKISSSDDALNDVSYIKDPIPVNAKNLSSALVSPKKENKQKKPKNLGYVPNKLKFKSMEVSGRLARPKVVFTRPVLRPEISEHITSEDFLEKSFALEEDELE